MITLGSRRQEDDQYPGTAIGPADLANTLLTTTLDGHGRRWYGDPGELGIWHRLDGAGHPESGS